MASGAMSVSLMKPSLICSFSGPLPAATAEAQSKVDATSAKSLITLTSPDYTWRVCAGGVKQSLCQRFCTLAASFFRSETAQIRPHRRICTETWRESRRADANQCTRKFAFRSANVRAPEHPKMTNVPLDLNLKGRRIAVPEMRELEVFSALLERRGAEVLRCPLVTIYDSPHSSEVLRFVVRSEERRVGKRVV